MRLEKAIFQRSYLYFIFFFLCVLLAFWLTYFVKIFDQENYRMHTHGITLVLWCLMLIIQPFLIRSKHYGWHRRIGRFSYVLVPLLVVTTMDLLLFRLKSTSTLGTMDYFFVALVVNALIAFLIFYGLAIFHRKKAVIHARWMICTVFPMFTPVTDRIIYIFVPSLVPFMPTIQGNPIVPAAGFLLADLILIGLSIRDWFSHKRWNVFPVALLVLLIYHYSVFNFFQFQFWKEFCNWLNGL